MCITGKMASTKGFKKDGFLIHKSLFKIRKNVFRIMIHSIVILMNPLKINLNRRKELFIDKSCFWHVDIFPFYVDKTACVEFKGIH